MAGPRVSIRSRVAKVCDRGVAGAGADAGAAPASPTPMSDELRTTSDELRITNDALTATKSTPAAPSNQRRATRHGARTANGAVKGLSSKPRVGQVLSNRRAGLPLPNQ